MFDRFTDRARRVVGLARRAAQEARAGAIGTEHLLLALLEEGHGAAATALRNLEVTQDAVRRELELASDGSPPRRGQLPFTRRLKRTLELACEEATRLRHDPIGAEHLLLGLLRVEESAACRALAGLGLDRGDVRAEVLERLGEEPPQTRTTRRKTKTPAIDAFGVDLVARARYGTLPRPVERSAELETVLAILRRREHGNALLVGPEGAGRRSLVHGLAHALARGEVPPALRLLRLVAVDQFVLVRGRRYPGQLEERIKAMGVEARRVGDVVFVFDDLAAVLPRTAAERAARRDGEDEDDRVFRVFAPGLAAGEFRCLGRISDVDHARRVVSDPALARLFDVVRVAPPEGAALDAILRAAREDLESTHGVRISDEALAAAASLDPLWPALAQPAAAIKLLDAAAARAAHSVEVGPDPRLDQLDAEITALDQQKEEAVLRQDFAEEAAYRDEVDRLRAERRRRLDDLQRERPNPAVEEAAVVALAAEQRSDPIWPAEGGGGEARPVRFERDLVRSLLPPGPAVARPGTAAVLLPPGDGAEELHAAAVRPALERAGLLVARLEEPYRPGGALAETWRLLREAELIVADASGRDPGVAFGLGLALALKRCPLLLVHDVGDLPAALRSLHALDYDPLDPEALRRRLGSAVEAFLAQTRGRGPGHDRGSGASSVAAPE